MQVMQGVKALVQIIAQYRKQLHEEYFKIRMHNEIFFCRILCYIEFTQNVLAYCILKSMSKVKRQEGKE